MTQRLALVAIIALVGMTALFAGCASKPSSTTTASGPSRPATSASKPARPGAYYKDDGPAAAIPADLDLIADAQPRDEPLHRFANRPYNVFGVNYTPMTTLVPLSQTGIASWYGRKFHGQKTAIGEIYDMFAMTAAHPTAPLPSFARVTNPRTSRSVIVRINDRGPFHAGRIVDLSYAAAHRLGIAQGGSGQVELQLLIPPFTDVVATASPAMRSQQPPPQPFEASPVVLAQPEPLAVGSTAQPSYYVQLGAFGNFANAQVFQQRMGIELNQTPRIQQVDSLFRVRLGPFATRNDATLARDRAQSVLSVPLPITSSSDR
jgi:rare lipoprotein A